MPRSTKQNEAMREATRAALIESAMALFAQNGYAHTSTRSLAQAAGISTGLMYHYFSSKEQLLRAVFDNCMAILGEGFTEALAQDTPQERLASLLREIFTILKTDGDFWSLFYMLRSQPAIMRELGDDFRYRTHHLRDCIEEDLRLLGRADPTLDALLVYSLIEGTIQQYLLEPESYPLEAVTERIIREFCIDLCDPEREKEDE